MAKFTRALSTVRQWCTIKRTKNQTIKSCNFRSCVSQNAKLPRAFLFHSRWQLSKVVTLHNILALSTKSCWKVVEVENPKEIAMTNLYYGITINISQFISIGPYQQLEPWHTNKRTENQTMKSCNYQSRVA